MNLCCPAQIQEADFFLESVLDSIGSGVIVMNCDGSFLFWNPAAESMFGKGPTAADPEQWGEIYGIYSEDGLTRLPQDQLPFVHAIRGETVTGHRIYVKNLEMMRGLWMSVSVRPLNDAEGKTVGGVIVLNDITDQKLLEKELLRSNSDLQQFASVAAHDLQEPLRTIDSFLEFLMNRHKGTFDEKSLEYVHFISDAVCRMKNLINDLLTYSRIHSNPIAFESIDCNQLVEEVLANLHASISESGAMFNIEPLPTIRAERAQLIQVFQNLIGNAIKFRCEDRQLVVNVRTQKKKSHWIFSVEDNGIGIAPDYAHRVFDIFQRLNVREKYPGSGIGLSVCKRIVERHNGVIFVESKLGEGSSFYFTIQS